MRGVPGTSLDIFNKMKASKGEAQVGGGSSSMTSNVGGYTSNESSSLREGAMGGGAYETLQRLQRSQAQNVGGVVFKHVNENDKHITTVNTSTYLDDMIALLSTNSSNLDNVIKVLLYLYLNNDLSSYEISGLDKETIVDTIKDFGDVLGKILI